MRLWKIRLLTEINTLRFWGTADRFSCFAIDSEKWKKSNIMVLSLPVKKVPVKNFVARSIHYHNSPKARKPFVTVIWERFPPTWLKVNCSGHEKGAFTDARDKRIGKFEETEWRDNFPRWNRKMDLSLQTKLLRVLQEKKWQNRFQ